MNCKICGEQLTGRQKGYCSPQCKATAKKRRKRQKKREAEANTDSGAK